MKPSMPALNDFATSNSYPIIAWTLVDGRVEPVSFGPPADAAAPRFVFAGSKIYQIDGPQWANYDLWSYSMLQTWKAARGVRESTIPPDAVTVRPGEAVTFLRS